MSGTPLKRQLHKSLRKQKLQALLLIAPLLFFVLFSFVWPITVMLFRSVENSIVADTLPRTVAALESWNAEQGELPDEATYAAFFSDMVIAVEARRHTRLGTRLNYEEAGMSSLFRRSGRAIGRLEAQAEERAHTQQQAQTQAPFKPLLIDIDERWGEATTWATIKAHSVDITNGYFLNAIDMRRTPQGAQMQPEDKQIMITLFIRTIWMSLIITGLCGILGYAVAWMLSILPTRQSNLLMICVLLPFWTSLLVRTSAWKVMLQQEGVINDMLVWLGLIADDARLVLINNQFGTIVAMTHILLPFMILPMYAVMKTIPKSYMRAARSLGANNWTAFWRIYFPQSVPGIGAGSILVFILAIGYYITPEIVGGTRGVFISSRIAYHISTSLNWGLAAALGAILLVVVLVLYWVYDKIVGIDNVKLG